MIKTAFVFPGQGSQYVGMGADLVKEYDVAQETFDVADEALGFKISEICFAGTEDKLRQTSFTQPAILTVNVAIARILASNALHPQVTAGHSLGEYSALVTAGVLDFSDAVRLVHIRGKLMEEALPQGQGAMAAVMGLDSEKLELACKDAQDLGVVQAVNYNCPGQIVIAGNKQAVEKASLLAKQYGAKRIFSLNVSGPFHSQLMANAGVEFSRYLDDVVFNEPKIPIVANYNAKPLTSIQDIKDALLLQIASPVLWEQSIRTMLVMGVNTFVEVGPGKVLSGLIKKITSDSTIISTDDKDSLIKCIALLKECG